jgi:hypothetical protein
VRGGEGGVKIPFISIGYDGIYLNNVKIIDRKAELQIAIFKILTHLYIEESYEGKIKYISITEISSLLKSRGFILEDPEMQIVESIYRIRSSIKSNFKNSQIHTIIESKKWKGYRLSNQIVLRKTSRYDDFFCDTIFGK